MSEESKDRYKRKWWGSSESALSNCSGLFALLGVVGVLVMLVGIGNFDAGGYQGGGLIMLPVGLAILLPGYVLSSFFTGMADMVKLLKALNGMPYKGKISGVKERRD